MLIVAKVGTNVLTNNSDAIQDEKIEQLVTNIVQLRQRGHQVILITSGAVALGRSKLASLEGSHKKQVWAAIGQAFLMERYNHYCQKNGFIAGQCLLLRNDFTNRERYDNFIGTIQNMLLDGNVLPVINENDVVATSDLTVGDNDLLSAMVAIALGADKLVLLTNQTGLYSANPDTDPKAMLIKEVANVDAELERLCSGGMSSLGRGGMLSKVRAAKHAVHAGIETIIVDGRQADSLIGIFSKDFVGTKFQAQPIGQISPQKRWMMSAKGFGQIVIDDGAVGALRNHKSLLLPGITAVKGSFEKGEIVEVVAKSGAAVAYGKVGYDIKEIQKTLTQRKQDKKISLPKEIIHYDHMVILTE
jgi:glutamate 5-kinase